MILQKTGLVLSSSLLTVIVCSPVNAGAVMKFTASPTYKHTFTGSVLLCNVILKAYSPFSKVPLVNVNASTHLQVASFEKVSLKLVSFKIDQSLLTIADARLLDNVLVLCRYAPPLQLL